MKKDERTSSGKICRLSHLQQLDLSKIASPAKSEDLFFESLKKILLDA